MEDKKNWIFIKKTILFFFVIIFLPILFPACGKSNVKQPDSTFYFASFRDIPGVTEDEIKAIEALQERYDLFVYAMIPSSEAFYDDNGGVGGFSTLFCEWLTRLFGIPFIPEFSEFDNLIAKLASNEIDFTGSLTPTAARRKIFSMTTPIALQTMQRFRIEGSLPLEAIAASRPLRYSFMRGTATINLVTPKLTPGTYELVLSTDIDDVYRMLKSGEVDAHFDSNREIAFDIYGDVVSSNFNPIIYTSASMMTQNPELSHIISIVQKALDNGALQHLVELHNAGYQEYLRHKLSLRLNEEERRYIREHSVVPFTAATSNYPVSFYNEREEQLQGVSFDILSDVAAITGLGFECVDPNALLSPLLETLENGKAAMITELMYSAERAEKFIWSKTILMTDYPALISRLDYRNISLNEVLYTKVGLIKNYAPTAMFLEWFPDHLYTIEYGNLRAAFNALDSGEVDVVMTRTRDLLLLTNYMERTNFIANYIFDEPINLLFAFNKDEAVLCSIIDKALRLIDTDRIADQWTNRTYDYNRKLVNAQRPWLIGSSILFLSALTLVTVLFEKNRRAGRQLAHQAKAVLAAARAKGIFLATMSHEIRTPLNAIIGMAYILKDCVDDNERALRSVNQIITSSHHLLGILNDILDMSKIESGKLELTYEPFSLSTACGEVADIMAHRCVEKNIAFITNIHEIKDITLTGDKLRLNQVLINLLGNAVKFTDADGEIKFIIEILKENAENVQIKFSVSDNGIGMSEEQMKKLFIPFEQTDNTIAARFGGTGLGLSLSQNFVNMMGGIINVDSKPDKGSSFDFSLYFDKGQLSAGEISDKKNENVNLRGKRILLAEDIEINRLIICELLSAAGPEIHEAENGRQAVDTFKDSPEGYYDIIMMDIQMPVLDGYEAAKEIRVLDRADAKTVPIIAMTAHAYKEDVEQALAVGMNGHLAKPIDKPALIETVGKIVKNKEG